MATTPSGGAFNGARQSGVNYALDAIYAHTAHKVKSRNLRKDTRRRAEELKTLKRRVEARADVAERQSAAINRTNAAVNSQNARLQAFVNRYENKAQAFQARWKTHLVKKGGKKSYQFEDSPKGKEQRAQFEAQQKLLVAMEKQANQRRNQLLNQSEANQSAADKHGQIVASAQRMNKRYKKKYNAYEASVEKYNEHADYVPYVP